MNVLLADARDAFVAAAAFAIEIPARPLAEAFDASELTRTDVILIAGRLGRDQGFADAQVTSEAVPAELIRIAVPASLDVRMASAREAIPFAAKMVVIAVLVQTDVLPAMAVDAFRRRAAKMIVVASVAELHVLPAGSVHAFRRRTAEMVCIASLAQIDVEGALCGQIEK